MDPDLLSIKFWAFFAFTSKERGESIEPFASRTTEIPRQQIPSEPVIGMKSVSIASVYAIAVSFLWKFMLNNLLNRMLSMVQALTMIAHMMLIDVWYPENCQKFFGEIFSLLAFDFIPTEYFYPLIFKHKD